MTSKKHRGFTLIEVLVDAFVITTVFGAIAASLIVVLKAVNSGKVRNAAVALANEQMETLRNLPYDSLATKNGTIYPQGTILDSQTVTRSGNNFTINTNIITIDDPYDGCAIPLGNGVYRCTDGGTSTQQDTVPVDYKRITVTAQAVNYPTITSSLVSNAAAKAAETPSNTGMLMIVVNDAQGNPIEGASVTITNGQYTITINAVTNAQGIVFIANLPLDNQNGYHIVATKAGFSADYTTTRTSQNPNQTQPDVDVNAQQITTQTLAIDELANLQATVKDQNGSLVSNIAVTATSKKTTQFNPVTAKNVYNATTDSSGLATFNSIEWDSYTLTVPSGYYIASTSPYQPVVVDPNTTTNTTMIVTTSSNYPQIASVSPTSAPSGQTVTITISGFNFPGNTTVSLQKSGQATIQPTTTKVATNQQTVTVTFNLVGAQTGSWDIVLTTGDQTIIQSGGLTVS